MYKIFFGHYELKSCGFGFIRIWHPNRNIELTADDQYKINAKNYADFNVHEEQKSELCGGK